ncbi:MAG: carbohydrate kinase family protein [Candidatus Taylorbacteria bacterium]
MFQKHIDILAIGDITVDIFIKMKDARMHCRVNNEACEICLPFGEKIPYEYTKVIYASGGASNAAIACARLGLKTSLITNLGSDQNARECILKLQKEKIVTSKVREHQNKPTNCNFVLWYDDDRTILVNHIDYEHNADILNPNVGISPKWIYLTSLSSHSPIYEDALIEYLEAKPKVKLVFQPGTFQINRGMEGLEKIVKNTEVFIVNVEEAQNLLRFKEKDVKRMLKDIGEKGPKIVLITDGINGAYMYDGDNYYQMPIYPDHRKAFERTGCGDAFASTFISMLSIGRSPLEALVAAPVNAMSVAQYIGAHEGLLSLEQLDWMLERAHEGYKVREI